jgi:hypothetical protein
MMSAVTPHVQSAAIKTPVMKAPFHHVVKTVDPVVTDKSITYKDFSSDPLFASNGPTPGDINQGYLGDCYLLSTLSSVAKTDPSLISKDIVADGNDVYTVTFGSGKGTRINVNADLPVWPDGQLAYAQLGNENSLWVALYEKAFVQYHNAKADNYARISGGWMSTAFSALGLKSTTSVKTGSATTLITTLAAELKAGDFTTFGTQNVLANGSPLIAGHAYEVDAVNTDSTGALVSITLRNPWGDGAADDGYVTVTAAQAFSAFAGSVIAHA